MKNTLNKLTISALAAFMALSFAGCGGSSSSSTSSDTTAADTTETVEAVENVDSDAGSTTTNVIEVSGEFDTVPDSYPFIAFDDFQTRFDEFYEKSNSASATSMTYDDVVEIFGAPGAYYVDKDYNDGQYKYYKWFSDADTDVMITFKGDGMTYYSWTSGTVTPTGA